MMAIEGGGGRRFGKRVLVGHAHSDTTAGTIRAFAPFHISTAEKLGSTYMLWMVRSVELALQARGVADTAQIEWETLSPRDLMDQGANL